MLKMQHDVNGHFGIFRIVSEFWVFLPTFKLYSSLYWLSREIWPELISITLSYGPMQVCVSERTDID